MSRWRQREWSTLKPRYTSYPTADRFVEAFGAQDYRQALRQRAKGGVVGGAAPLSIYVHIPFGKSVCYYCACNKIITKHHERGRAYLQSLAAEIDLHTAELGRGQSVSQLQLGGGSPTFLSDDELSDLMDMLRGAFVLSPRAEVAIEVDPRTADPQRLQHLAALGFNRISFGIQDFDPAVQAAVHRVQSFESVQALMGQAKALGFQSLNADLIYGLPMQTPESFQRTVAQVAELRPHRIALYAYAHLPERFKPQRCIPVADLPPRRHLQPELQDVAGVHRRAVAGLFPGGARPGADARRPDAPLGHHGVDVPGPAGLRVHRPGAPGRHPQPVGAGTGAAAALGRDGAGRAQPGGCSGHAHWMVLRARRGLGVRPPSPRRREPPPVFTHPLKVSLV